MPRVPTAAPLALALLLVGASLLAPLASADHVYSHRYVIWGRAVDADGNPVENVTMEAMVTGIEFEGPCADHRGTQTHALDVRPQPTTDANGEFVFCIHVHAIPRTVQGLVRLRAAGTERVHDFPIDPFTRHTFALVVLDDAQGAAPPAQHTVMGVAWRASERIETVEGVPVYGRTVDNAPVLVRVEPAEGEPVELDTATNAYGEFALRVPLADPFAPGRVVVTVQDETFELNLTKMGVTYVRAAIAPAAATPSPSPTPSPSLPSGTPMPSAGAQEGGVRTDFQEGGDVDADGGARTQTPGPGALVVPVVALAALALRRRRAA